MDNVDIWDIIGKHLNNTASVEEERTLNQWLEVSKSNQSQFYAAKNIWEVSGKITYQVDVNVEEDWHDFKSQISSSTVKPLLANGNNVAVRMIYKVAAGVAILLVASIVYFQFVANQDSLITYEAVDKPQLITLTDGSEIWVNKNSSLTYDANSFSQNRHVELKGEGYFEIKPNTAYPFTVKAGNSITTVVGTSFNIDASDPLSEVALVVVTGKVKFGPSDDSSLALELQKGDKGILDVKNGSLNRAKEDGTNFLAWKTDALVFENKLLSSVIADCEKYFNVSIKVDQQAILNCRYTGTFDSPDLDHVLTILSSTLNLSFKTENDVVYLDGEGCANTD